MTYTRPRSRGEAALSRNRRSHRISSTDRPGFRVNDGPKCLRTIVPVAIDAVGPVERPCAIFDRREAPRAVSGRGRA
jgi:hypothetical protein